jgi:hypothetical protein
MAWSPPPPDPPPAGWWVELQYNRRVARGAAEIRAREQDKRRRQLRRRVERVDEALCLAESASEARRHLRQQGLPYELYEKRRSDRLGPIEYGRYAGARVLSVR